jgi:hypothetical protein
MKKLLILLLVVGVGSLTSCGKKGGSEGEGGAPVENTTTETPTTEPAANDTSTAKPAEAEPQPKPKDGGH